MDCPKRSTVDGLPEDSLVEILARVPVRSVYRAKCVAKGWRDLIEDPLHRKKLPQTLQGFFSVDKEIYGGGHIGFTSLRARSAPLGIDRRLSFLTKLPGIEVLTLANSCNGLLLFEHGLKWEPSDLLGCIVCNPATKDWVSVPRYGSLPPRYLRGETRYTYLVFDPVVSPYFHIVQFWIEFWRVVSANEEEEVYRMSVHIYSSESGTWSHIQSDWREELGELEGWRHQGFVPHKGRGCAVLDGVLHFIISDQQRDRDQIVAVDVQGETQRIIPLPAMAMRKLGYVAQSQGHLHYISQASDAQAQLSIWVLEDTHKWVLKHSVSFVELFGKRKRSDYNNQYNVVGMHPDGNVVFLVQNQKLISYDMDHKLRNVIATSEDNISADHIVPYVPYFVESPALTNKTEMDDREGEDIGNVGGGESSDIDDRDGEDIVSDGGGENSNMDDRDGEDSSSDGGGKNSDMDGRDGEDSGSDGDGKNSDMDDEDGEDTRSDGGGGNFDMDEGDGEDGGSENSDTDDEDGEDSGSDGGGENSDTDDEDGEDSGSDGGGENYDMDDEDGEDSGSDGGDYDSQ